MTKVLAWLALPFVGLAMLVAPLLGVHFCPLEATPILLAAGSLPFVGPALRARMKKRSGPHCCQHSHHHEAV